MKPVSVHDFSASVHDFSASGEEKPLSPGAFSLPGSVRHFILTASLSLERGHAFCFTHEGAEVREVKWFEHSQDWNPGSPKAYLLSVFWGEEGVEHEVLESHHLPLKVLCPKCHAANFLMSRDFWGG